MKRAFALVICSLIGTTSLAHAASDPTRADAIAFVNKAIATLKKDGQAKAFAEFDDPANKVFHKGALYIFVYDKNGRCVAHGANAHLIGLNLMDWKDADGKKFVREYIDQATAHGKAWTNYKFYDPVNKQIEPKQAYVVNAGNGLFVGTGIYQH